MNICIIDPYENIRDKLERISAFGDPFIRVPLMEDLTIVAESNLNSLREKIPTAAGVISTLADLEQAIKGTATASKNAVGLATKLGAPQWSIESTKPIEVQVKLGFFTEVQNEKPLNTPSGLAAYAISQGINKATGNYQPGHWIHTLNKLISYSILSVGANGQFLVPGVGLKDLKVVKDEIAAKNNPDPLGGLGGEFNPFRQPNPRLNTTSKLVHLTIPGIIDIPIAVIPRVTVNYSKHITELGYPLWATAEVQIQGIIPAMSTDFINGATVGKQLIATNLI